MSRKGMDMCVVRTLNERFILTICSVYTFIDWSCFSKIKTTQNYYFYIEEEALEKVARGTVKIKHRGAYKLNCLYLLTYLQYMLFKMHTTFSSLICLYVFSFFYIFQIKYYTSSRRGYFLWECTWMNWNCKLMVVWELFYVENKSKLC